MVFSSPIFLFYFLPLAVLVYHVTPRGFKNAVLAIFSFVFYGWWDPRLVLLMLGTMVVDYLCGKVIAAPGASRSRQKAALLTSVISNLLCLGFFKYSAFVAGSLTAAVHGLGGDQFGFPAWVYLIPLPIGISFYTFQSMSYCLDLYRGHAPPARSFVDFACYVSMFPQLVAGPIVRYGSVAEPLARRRHTIEHFVYGFTRFNFGFAKKILLANPMGTIADACFNAGDGSLEPLTAWAGILAYAFQIYFDFSAYSDMALGLGRMFGFTFPENFNQPYRAVSLTDFWRRWHISLSTFLRDYLYIPLGGNRLSLPRTYANLLITMLIGGLWHGAQWTFLIWGAWHGAILAVERLLRGRAPAPPRPVGIAVTFLLVLLGWVFFRAENLEVAMRYLRSMFGLNPVWETAGLLSAAVLRPYTLMYLGIGAFAVWVCPQVSAIVHRLTSWKVAAGFALLILGSTAMFTQGFNPFLYFQF